MAGSRFLLRLRTVRARTTLGAAVVVGLALTAGALILLVVLHRSLVAGMDVSVRIRAESIASLARNGALPQRLPEAEGRETSFDQVVDPAGKVVAATANIEAEGPVLPARPPGHNRLQTITRSPVDGDRRFRLVVRTVSTPSGTYTVYAAGSLATADHSVAVVTRELAVGGPILLLVVTAMTWVVVGRALSPVEAIRAEVARISTLALDRRVPEPAVADEVGRLARTMNEMLDRLAASDRLQRRFVADASHELRSPLAAVHAQLEVGLAHPETTDWPSTAHDVLADVARLQRLAEQLLALARAEGPVPVRQPVDLDDLVLQEVRRAQGANGLDVDGRGVSAARVSGDPDQLHRVVRNLVDNACRHARGLVTVGLRAEGTMAVLTVADDGAGIPAADRERVFERFTRLDDARAVDRGGSGLGLAIARSVVVAHGGSITAEDPPAGASLVVRLPLSPPA
jgi:signal transduction histidine kinase